MNIRKKLKELAKQDIEPVNERDLEFLRSRGVDITLEEIKPATVVPSRKPMIIALACTAVAILTALVIVLCIFLPRGGNVVEPPFGNGVFYLEENEKNVESNLDELNSDAEKFYLEIPESIPYKIEKFYDSVSGDTLYYKLKINSDELQLRIDADIVVNKNYDHPEVHYLSDPVTGNLYGYEMIYIQSIKDVEGTSIKQLVCYGEIEIDEQMIYVNDYKEYSGNSQTFIDTLSSIIKIKN